MIGTPWSRRPRTIALAVMATVMLSRDVARAASPDPWNLEAARQRPLFAPTRRPQLPPQAAEPVDPVQPTAAVEQTLNVEVRGIVVGGNHRIAIIKRPSSPQTIDVAVGSDVDGWTVDEIRPRGIVLHRDSRTVTLSMPEPGR